LIANGVIVAVSFMAYALFRPDTPHWIIYAVLLAGGFFRSLQFTSLNGMAFADVDHAQMSRASTMSTMGQQVSQSMGVGMAAVLLGLFEACAHTTRLTSGVVAPTFEVIGLVSLISLAFFIPLPRNAGEGLHGSPRQ
jgi:hypothetical protein